MSFALIDLIRRAAAGDAAATESLLVDCYPRVRALVHGELERDFRRHHQWLLPLFSTGDIVQDVFIGVVRGISSLDVRDEAGVIGWLATQVKHRILDVVRHHEAMRRDRRRDVALAVDDDRDGVEPAGHDPSPSRCAELAELLRVFDQALTAFSARERALLDLRLHQDKSWRAIAEALGFPSEDAARQAFRYLKARLLVKLRHLGLRPPTIGETDGGASDEAGP